MICARLEGKKGLSFAALTLESVVKQSQHPILKIDRLDAIESGLQLIVLLYPASRSIRDEFLHGFAVALRRKRLEFAFHDARLGAGYLGMAFLVAPDIARQRIPDHRQLAAGALAVVPARHDDLCVDGDLDVADAATATFLNIGRLATETDFGGAGVAGGGAVRRRAATAQLVVQLVCRLPLDIEIGIAFRRNDFGCRGAAEEKGNHCKGDGKAYITQRKRHSELNLC